MSSLEQYLQSSYWFTSATDQERATIYFNGLEAGQVIIADRVLRAVQSAGVNIPTALLGPIWDMCVLMGDIRSGPLNDADTRAAPVSVALVIRMNLWRYLCCVLLNMCNLLYIIICNNNKSSHPVFVISIPTEDTTWRLGLLNVTYLLVT